MATQNSIAGAEAAASHFLDALNTAYKAPDTSVLLPLYDSSCTACQQFQDDVIATAKKGDRFSSNIVTRNELHAASLADDQSQVIVTLTQNAAYEVDSTGRTVDSSTKSTLQISIRLTYKTFWKVSSFKKVQT